MILKEEESGVILKEDMDIDLCLSFMRDSLLCTNRFYYSSEKKICGCFDQSVRIDVIRVPKDGFREYYFLRGYTFLHISNNIFNIYIVINSAHNIIL